MTKGIGMRRRVGGVALALALSACGEPSRSLGSEPACRAWFERLESCIAAAPAGLRVALEPTAAFVQREGRRVPSGAFLAESCEAARLRVTESAAAICPEVSWGDE